MKLSCVCVCVCVCVRHEREFVCVSSAACWLCAMLWAEWIHKFWNTVVLFYFPVVPYICTGFSHTPMHQSCICYYFMYVYIYI